MHENDDGRGRFWRASIPNVNLLERKKSISYNIIFNPNLQRNVLSCFDWPGASSHFGCNCNRGSFSRGRQQRSVRVAFLVLLTLIQSAAAVLLSVVKANHTSLVETPQTTAGAHTIIRHTGHVVHHSLLLGLTDQYNNLIHSIAASSSSPSSPTKRP